MTWYKSFKDNIWHPYTQYSADYFLEPLKAVRTAGSRIYFEDGTEMIDGISSWWSVPHGYNHPHILSKISQQLAKMPHVMFGGIAHEPAYELAGRLCEFANLPDYRVFFADSGSVAAEVAIKMSIQYHSNRGNPHKNKIVSFINGYHGDTTGAMSVSDLDGMHKAFKGVVMDNYCIDVPRSQADLAAFEDFLKKNHQTIGVMMIEPLVQCAGGMVFHEPDILKSMCQICHKYDILTVFDEIAVGFYRIGKRFAFHEVGINPNILLIGKALTGGIMSLAAAIASPDVFAEFVGDISKTFMHGPTFMANPLACSASLASLDLFEQNDYAKMTAEIERIAKNALKEIRHKTIDVRVKGALIAAELDPAIYDIRQIRAKCLARNTMIRPIFANNGNIMLYLAPPLNISANDLQILLESVINALNSTKKKE